MILFEPEIREILKGSAAQPVDPMTQADLDDRKTDRTLKSTYAIWFIYILIGQLLLMNVIVFLAGLKVLVYEEWVLNLFMSGTLAEVFLIVMVITKNLFPTRQSR